MRDCPRAIPGDHRLTRSNLPVHFECSYCCVVSHSVCEWRNSDTWALYEPRQSLPMGKARGSGFNRDPRMPGRTKNPVLQNRVVHRRNMERKEKAATQQGEAEPAKEFTGCKCARTCAVLSRCASPLSLAVVCPVAGPVSAACVLTVCRFSSWKVQEAAIPLLQAPGKRSQATIDAEKHKLGRQARATFKCLRCS